MMPDRCQYSAGGRYALLHGERLETIDKTALDSYARNRGGFWDGRAAVLAEETRYMHRQLCVCYPSYPPCEITGESVAVEAKLNEATRKVTAYFVCKSCGG